MSRGRRIALTFITALVIGSVANVVIEARQVPGARAVAIGESGELAALAAVTQRSVAIAYGFTAALHDVAAGGVLVVNDGTLVAGNEIQNLARMDVAVEDYDSSISVRLAIELDERAEARGEGALRRDGPETTWAIVTNGAAAAGTRLRLVFFEDAAFAVDETILAELQS